MKTPFIFLANLLLLFSCAENEQKISTDIIHNPHQEGKVVNLDNAPVLTFKEDRIDFGTISQGESITREFEFTNTGKAALLIENITGSCGCTVARDWPKEPVQPGESGKFSVTYESGTHSGMQVKQITVSANTHPATTTVALAGNVAAPEKSKP